MKRLLTAVCTVLALAAMAGPAQAQVQFGPQASYADDFDFGVGARAQFGLGSMMEAEGGLADLVGIASFDFFFPDCGGADCSAFEVNANVVYPFVSEQSFTPYAGGGLNIGRFSVSEVSDTEIGLNALGGLEFAIQELAAFVEARFELSGYEQFVLTFGVLFGGGD